MDNRILYGETGARFDRVYLIQTAKVWRLGQFHVGFGIQFDFNIYDNDAAGTERHED